jgi:hypothetical protein
MWGSYAPPEEITSISFLLLSLHTHAHTRTYSHTHTLIALTAVQRETFELSHVPRLSN